MMDRTAAFPIDPIFIERWSPRAFHPEPMPTGALLTILEAARWAPSAYNVQPWRFLYALRDDAHWPRFLSLLDSFNQSWAGSASALVFLLSDTGTDDAAQQQASPIRSFDTGAAWSHIALQAVRLGYHAHAMAGIAFEAARTSLAVPPRFRIEIAVALGRRAAPETLPPPLREREWPSPRRSLTETAFAGSFPA
ncbi:nitroreductase family protein [Bosea rubneri]|uniref:Nitroreductase family protein n=1 Tax=Bosea rubneri TaxID=3075434 RepID=A0ABU3S971_9HYPH|nr:nitroreductase family protein [Bosea sp. ZW T0_25]MDU0340905.1 nitroreductase family protein [Bosea sp. ZW T0_25]